MRKRRRCRNETLPYRTLCCAFRPFCRFASRLAPSQGTAFCLMHIQRSVLHMNTAPRSRQENDVKKAWALKKVLDEKRLREDKEKEIQSQVCL